MPGEKIIKIKYEIDEQSARRTKKFVDDITASVDNLVKSAEKAGSALHSMGSRGGVLGGASVSSRKAGVGSLGMAKGPKGGIFQSVLGGDAGMVRALTMATQQGFSATTMGINNLVDNADRKVRKLQESIKSLNQSFTPSKNPMVSLGDQTGGAWNFMSNQGGPVASMRSGMGSFSPTKFLRGGGRFNYMDRIGEQYSRVLGGEAKGPGDPGSNEKSGGGGLGGVNFKKIASMLGIPLAMGAGGGVVYAAMKAYEYAVGGAQTTRNANLDFNLNKGVQDLQRGSAAASPFRGAYGRVKGGDVAYGQAILDTLKDQSVRDSFSASAGQAQLDALRIKSGLNDYSIGGGMARVGSKIGKIAYDASFGRNDPFGASKSTDDIAAYNARAQVDPEFAARYQAAIEAKYNQQDPRYMGAVNDLYGARFANAGLMRSGFMGGGYSRVKSAGRFTTQMLGQESDHGKQLSFDEVRQLAGKTVEVYSPNNTRAAYTAAGYDVGEGAAMQQAIRGAAGYAQGQTAASTGAIRYLSMQAGGLQGIPGLLRSGGMMGGAQDYLNAVNMSIGGKGLDVTAGSELGASLAARILQGGAIGNMGASEAYGRAAGIIREGADSAGEQMRRTSQLMSGIDAESRIAERSGFDQAAVLQNAIMAAGGSGAGEEKLRRLLRDDPTLLHTIAEKGSQFAPEWVGGDVTQKTARDFLTRTQYQPFLNVGTAQLTNPREKALLERLRTGQQSGKTLREMGFNQSDTGSLAGILASSGQIPQGQTMDTVQGTIRQLIGADSVQGTGARSGGMDEVTRASLRAQATEEQKTSELLAKKKGETEGMINNIPKLLNTSVEAIPGAVSNFTGALEKVSKELIQWMSDLKAGRVFRATAKGG